MGGRRCRLTRSVSTAQHYGTLTSLRSTVCDRWSVTSRSVSLGGIGLLIVRRFAAAAVLLAIISFGVFGLLYLAPGSVEHYLLGTRPASPAAVRIIRHEYHLDS